MDENLPMDVLEMLADQLKEDCRQIRQAVNEMIKEQEMDYERT